MYCNRGFAPPLDVSHDRGRNKGYFPSGKLYPFLIKNDFSSYSIVPAHCHDSHPSSACDEYDAKPL